MFVGWEGVGICSYLLVNFWFTRTAANQSALSALLTNRVGDCFFTIGMLGVVWSIGNLDYSTVFSLAPFVNENVVTIIGICLLIGAMAKSSQVGLVKANKKWLCWRFFSSFINAWKISNALEPAGPVSVHKCSRLNHKNILGVRHYSTKLTIWGKDLESRVGISLSQREGGIIKLPSNIQSIIIGLMLSRGRLQRSNGLSSNARLSIGHSIEYSIYIWYLFSLLSPYCSSYPYIYDRKIKLAPVTELRSRSLPCFTELYLKFYIVLAPAPLSKGNRGSSKPLRSGCAKKIIPANIFDLLTREALAHWFLSSKVFIRDRNVILIISSFSLVEAVRLMNVLLIKYEIISTLVSAEELGDSNLAGGQKRKGSSTLILISEQSHIKFKSLVDPYISNFVLSLLGLNKLNYMIDTPKVNALSTNNITTFSISSPVSIARAVEKVNTDPEKFQRQGINKQDLDQLTVYNKLVNKLHNKNFLDWFIGFTEGDGSLVLSGGKSIFSIHLHIADLPLLYIIQNELNLGNVHVKKNSAQFYVKAKKDIFTLISIFNGNLFLTKRQEQFKNWLVNYNIKNKSDIPIKPFIFKPSLKDSWLAGFTDAEGCFTASVYKNRRVTQKFILVQKAADLEMNYLSSLIGGIYYKEKNEMSRVYIVSSKCDSLIEYLSRHKLYSMKLIAFEKWKEIYEYRKTTTLSSDLKYDYPFLKKKSSLINSIRKVPLLNNK